MIILCSEGRVITDTIIVEQDQREFMKEVCVEFGYVPVFSVAKDGYIFFTAIKLFEEC